MEYEIEIFIEKYGNFVPSLVITSLAFHIQTQFTCYGGKS